MRADNAAHIGGFLAGAGAAFFISDADRIPHPILDRLWSGLSIAGLLVTVASFALLAVRWAEAL
jgi:hypothetical protein